MGNPRISPSSSGPVMVRPSLRLVRPLYYLAFTVLALDAGLITNSTEGKSYYWLLIFPVALLAFTIRIHMRQHFHVITVGGGKLRYETGMMSKTTRTMDLSKIQDVRVDQSLLQRMLGIGTIGIETAGEAGGLTMANIDKPQAVADYILEAAGK